VWVGSVWVGLIRGLLVSSGGPHHRLTTKTLRAPDL